MACLALMLLSVTALAEVTITEEQIAYETEDLSVSFRYPTFTSSDASLAQALDATITQGFAARLNALYAEYEKAVTERTPGFSDYADPEVYDEIRGTYDVESNGSLVQFSCIFMFHPYSANGNWDKAGSYCFDTASRRLLAPSDFFAEDADTVYARLNAVAAEKVAKVEYYSETAVAAITPTTPFYYDTDTGALCFLFDPYVLMAGVGGVQTVRIPVTETGLTFVPR